jgi:hypothetical protein
MGRATPPTQGTTNHASKKKEDKEGVAEGGGRMVNSRPSDFKRRAVAEGKSVVISYLDFFQTCFFPSFKFPLCILDFPTVSCMLDFFSRLSLFYKNPKNIM